VTANAVTLNQAIGRCHLQFDDRQRLRSAVLLAPDARSALVPVSLLLARSGSLADLAQLPAARSSAIELLRQTAIAATTLEPKA
jgi:hypothetical protein